MSHPPVLIVDDSPENLALMRQVLAADHKLVFARNGEEALEVAARHLPALVLLDIEMPGMNGFEVCMRLKADPVTEAIPVIFVTSLSEVGNEERGFSAGCVDYIVKPISPPLVQARVRTHLSLVRASKLRQSHRDAISMLGEAGHFNDTDTGSHIWRMAEYARVLAEGWGWDPEQCEMLELAAPMHDTGKIGIPDAILRKPAKLDIKEWDVMKTHAVIGHDILARSEAPIFQMAAEIALRHHEKWDGSGYPDGLRGADIPESARIVAVADVFDALTMRRPYKDPWPLERVVETMRNSAGSHFDPGIAELFQASLARILAVKERWRDDDHHLPAV